MFKVMTTQTILITGAGSGLGQALALQLAKPNTHLLLNDVSEDALVHTVSLLDQVSGAYSTVPFDLSSLDGIPNWVHSMLEKHTSIDWVINCAGISITSAALHLNTIQWQRILAINLQAVITLSTVLGQHMVTRGTGRIINIASMFGQLPAPSGIAYATTKHALVGFTRTLQIEMSNTGVMVHLVCPGFIRTKLFANAEYIGVEKEMLQPDTSTMLTASDAANKILQGIQKNRSWIVFPLYVKMLWWLEWCAPWLARWIWAQEWRKFRESAPSQSS